MCAGLLYGKLTAHNRAFHQDGCLSPSIGSALLPILDSGSSMKPFRSCMVVLSVTFLLVLLLFFGSATYAHLRMWYVNNQLFQVAEQLGYTPDALLQHEMDSHDFDFVGNTICDANLYFTTTLSLAEFRKGVEQVLPETSGQGWSVPVYLPSLRGLRFNAEEVTSYLWLSRDSKADISLTFNDLANISAPVDYKGLPVTGNIVKLHKSGGAVQTWACPRKVTENVHLPSD